MPLTISTEAASDKNKLRSNVVWIDFVEFIYPGEDPVRVCSDNQVTTWNGHDWQPVAFVPPEIQESKNAQIPDVKFIFVANGATDKNKALIIQGNERVLRARLSDAKFFWDQDVKTQLLDLLPKLSSITLAIGARQLVVHDALE